MEGGYLLRLTAVFALLIGSLYVLSPTLLVQNEVDVGSYERNVGISEPPLELWFTTEDADPDPATRTALRARLDAAGIAVERVAVKDEQITVTLRPGSRKADAEAAIDAAPEVGLYGPEAVGFSPDDEGSLPGDAQRGAAVAADALPLAGAALRVSGEGAVEVTATSAIDADPIFLAVGGRVVAYASGPIGPNMSAAVTVLDDSAQAIGALRGANMPEPLVRIRPQAATRADDAAAPRRVLSWWESLLPDTRLSLGLDLQGGVDITLQVDLDAAVLGQVRRDRTSLLDQASRDGLSLSISRERARPALRVRHEGDMVAVNAFLREQLREYNYIDDITEGSDTYAVWRLRDERDAEIRTEAVEQVLETLRRRVDSTGVKEPSIVKLGGGRINIQLPGVSGSEAATDAIGTQAVLEFRLVDEKIDQRQIERMVTEAQRALPKEQFEDDLILDEWLRDEGRIAEDRVLRWEYEELEGGSLVRTSPIVLMDEVLLTGADVAGANVGWDENNQPRVLLDFKARGRDIFCKTTTENVRKRFGIILDDQVRSAPSIRSPICGGSASIEMGTRAGAKKDANMLAVVLRTGSLSAPVDIGEVREIGASLGQDAIRSGLFATGIGGTLTLLFMGLWYRKPGIIADAALVLNVMMVFALLAMFGATLTLPGIAGVALTVGMAVDANIIVFERIREELSLGANARKAVDAGYEKALSAVLDANITTGIAGVVLYSYGTGPVRGFAVTLMIGIVTTLVTALFVTRVFMDLLTRSSTARLKL